MRVFFVKKVCAAGEARVVRSLNVTCDKLDFKKIFEPLSVRLLITSKKFYRLEGANGYVERRARFIALSKAMPPKTKKTYTAAQKKAWAEKMKAARAKPKAKPAGFGKATAGNAAGAKHWYNTMQRRIAPATGGRPSNWIGSEVFDARKNWSTCLTAAPSLGSYTSVLTKERSKVGTGILSGGTDTQSVLLLMSFSTWGCGLVAIDVIRNAGGTAYATGNGKCNFLEISQLVANQPQNIRHSRQTLSLIAETKADDVTGSIFAVMTPAPINIVAHASAAGSIDDASVTTLVNLAEASTNSKQYSADFFRQNKSISLGFSSLVSAQEWRDFSYKQVDGSAFSAADAGQTQRVARLKNDLKLCASTSLLVYLPNYASMQDFMCCVTTQSCCRYEANNILSSAGLLRSNTLVVNNELNNRHAERVTAQGDILVSRSGAILRAARPATEAAAASA